VTRFYWTPRGVLSILGFVHADGAITERSTLDVAAADPSMRELPVGEVDARAAGREGDRLPLRDLRAVRGDRALAGCARLVRRHHGISVRACRRPALHAVDACVLPFRLKAEATRSETQLLLPFHRQAKPWVMKHTCVFPCA
jgi:hypothetical protein